MIMPVSYVSKLLSRCRRMVEISAILTAATIFGVYYWSGMWQPAAICGTLIGILGVMFTIQASEVSEVNFFHEIVEGKAWLLWTGYFIAHQPMTKEISKEIVPDTKRALLVAPHIHVCRTRKDLMLLKLSLGDYL